MELCSQLARIKVDRQPQERENSQNSEEMEKEEETAGSEDEVTWGTSSRNRKKLSWGGFFNYTLIETPWNHIYVAGDKEGILNSDLASVNQVTSTTRDNQFPPTSQY